MDEVKDFGEVDKDDWSEVVVKDVEVIEQIFEKRRKVLRKW